MSERRGRGVAWVRDERDIGGRLWVVEYTCLLAGGEGRSYGFFCDVRGYQEEDASRYGRQAGRTAYVELELLVKWVGWRTRCRTWGTLRGEQEISTQSDEGSGRWFHGDDGASAGPVST